MANRTIVDIAKAAGVSFKTVSRVVNREPSVRKETRELVESVIAKLNYEPNLWARALRSSRSHLIGMICGTFSPDYVNRFQIALMKACQRAGYHLVVEEAHAQSGLAGAVRSFLHAVQLDGVVLLPPFADNPIVVGEVRKASLPLVRVAPYGDPGGDMHVDVDDFRAAFEITDHLRALGHRDIGFIKGPAGHAASQQRLRGFLASVEAGGLDVPKNRIVSGAFTLASGAAATEKLLRARPRPSAIFASNDEMAFGVISTAARMGISVPDELSVVGFDDSSLASQVWPPLTTVRQPIEQMAQAAAEMLVDRIEGRDVKASRQVRLEVIVRKSVSSKLPARAGKRRNRSIAAKPR